MRVDIFFSVLVLSILHGLIPSHWTPVMVLKKQYRWGLYQTFRMVSLLNFSHVLSTVVIGFLFSFVSSYITSFLNKEVSVKIFSAIVLFTLGVYFIYRHYYHHHFHLYHQDEVMKQKNLHKQIIALNIGMLFSPCMEITALYFVGGMFNWRYVVMITIVYFVVSFISSVFWVLFFDKLSEKLNFHKIEHYGGLLSGASLILSAVILFFV